MDVAITGKGGFVEIDSGRIAEIADWSLDCDADDIDVTNFDSDGWKEFLAGLKEWSGSFEGNFVYDDPTDGSGKKGQKTIFEAWTSGTKVKIGLKVSDAISFEGDSLLKPSVETPHNEKASFSCNYQGTGKLTLPD